MNRRRYWKNRIPFLLTNLVCMAALTVFLLVCGNSISAVLLILVVWAVVLLTGLFLTYWKPCPCPIITTCGRFWGFPLCP